MTTLSVICAVAVGLTVVLFAPYAYYIPKSALAGILMIAAWQLVDRLWYAFRREGICIPYPIRDLRQRDALVDEQAQRTAAMPFVSNATETISKPSGRSIAATTP